MAKTAFRINFQLLNKPERTSCSVDSYLWSSPKPLSSLIMCPSCPSSTFPSRMFTRVFQFLNSFQRAYSYSSFKFCKSEVTSMGKTCGSNPVWIRRLVVLLHRTFPVPPHHGTVFAVTRLGKHLLSLSSLDSASYERRLASFLHCFLTEKIFRYFKICWNFTKQRI